MTEKKTPKMSIYVDDELREDLNLLASMEKRSMSAILTDLMRGYVREHSQQLELLKEAMTEARNMTPITTGNDG